MDDNIRGHVYVCTLGEQVKIGRSEQPWRRLEALRQQHPGLGLAMVYCTDPLQGSFLVEACAHQLLAHRRMDGEWFSASESEAEWAVKQAVKEVKKGWRFPAICVRGGMPRHREALEANGVAIGHRRTPPKDWPDRWKR